MTSYFSEDILIVCIRVDLQISIDTAECDPSDTSHRAFSNVRYTYKIIDVISRRYVTVHAARTDNTPTVLLPACRVTSCSV